MPGPLELISGPELVDLLHRRGLRGRLGEGGGRPTAAGPTPVGPGTQLPADYNILGMSWTGSVALDVCALVCRGNRVLSDDHFVFFNNHQTPDGAVRALPAAAPDRAAICVTFDRRSNEDWDFVLGGKGCTGGLEELVQDFGIVVEQSRLDQLPRRSVARPEYAAVCPSACPVGPRRAETRTAILPTRET